MEPIINRTDASVPARQVPPASKTTGASSAEESPPVNQMGDASALVAKVANAGPDLRLDEIERCKGLVDDPNYPSDEILETLADTLLRSDDFSGAL
ncbi:MAG: hypothetical protein VCA36_01445 [Opitutales bacterium]